MIGFLEEQIVCHERDIEPTASVVNGFGENEVELQIGNQKKRRKGLITQEIAGTFITIPKDFFCLMLLDLMRDPVIISTGQTYDRSSISRWMEEGHCTCPKTGQILMNTLLVPNRALRNLIERFPTFVN
ncbi:hypothetical protein OIU84_002968 [Salix udensis]|uniref:RING-type E3 ubiquitin transferase n=1 Tax=Salix udensis TaxID=889485 RepID=A0AAD6K5T4_9ROSI|nr:hypothetical protein OIU84_002968 [Salix udensis]